MREITLQDIPREITLQDIPVLESLWRPLCKKYDLKFPEYSAANVFLFRRQHHYKLIEGATPLVQGQFSSKCHYFIPTKSPEQFGADDLPKGHCFFPVSEEWRQILEPLGFTLYSERADADYLFHIEKLRTFPGRVLSSRRNLLSQLTSSYQVKSVTLTKRLIPEALSILDTWQKESHAGAEKTDYEACREALEHFEELKLFGFLAYADNTPMGFTIGEMLTDTTALLHFSKAVHAFKGATPWLYQDFAKRLPSTVQWINLEQDLGIESLRQAKKAYDPDLILTKWRVCHNKDTKQ